MTEQTKPRIGVDGYNLALARGTGIATYARTLTHCLERLGHPIDVLYGLNIQPNTPATLQEVQFFDQLATERGPRRPKFPAPDWWKQAALSTLGRTAFQVPITGRVVADSFEGRMPRYDRILNVHDLWVTADRHFKLTGRFLRLRWPDTPSVAPPAIMHWTYPLPILLEGARNIYTIHDLVPLRLPHTTLDNKQHYFRLITGCLRWGDHVCTVSDTSRQDIIDLFPGTNPARITNTYQSFAPPTQALAMSDAEVADQVRGLFGLEPEGYFLYFGAIEPKKNVGRLLEAYLTGGFETPMVVVSARSWQNEAETRLLNPAGTEHGRARNVIQMEYMPAAMLTTLVRGAKAVCFPSLYEGFGLPVLEAMALGTPTLTSSTGSLPEITGGASLAIDPYDTTSIAAGLHRLHDDPALRAELSAKGRIRAADFDMPHYQARVAAMYDQMMATPRNRSMLSKSRET